MLYKEIKPGVSVDRAQEASTPNFSGNMSIPAFGHHESGVLGITIPV